VAQAIELQDNARNKSELSDAESTILAALRVRDGKSLVGETMPARWALSKAIIQHHYQGDDHHCKIAVGGGILFGSGTHL
jgi:hypothetical protein